MVQVNITSYTVRKGPGFTLTIEKPETELTPELMASGAWKTKKFKPYNFDALGAPTPSGHLHPLLKVGGWLQIFGLHSAFRIPREVERIRIEVITMAVSLGPIRIPSDFAGNGIFRNAYE